MPKYKQNKIVINKVYTKKGDEGFTSLVGGKKVKKNNLRIQVFGEIDELNVYIGSCSVFIKDFYKDKKISSIILTLDIIQHELFNLGNMIATPKEFVHDKMPKVDKDSVDFLEEKINYYNKNLDTLLSFVLPGGGELNIRFHIARTICRKCERLSIDLQKDNKMEPIVLVYLNRLSDLLFVLSRYVNHILGKNEKTWNPNIKNKNV